MTSVIQDSRLDDDKEVASGLTALRYLALDPEVVMEPRHRPSLVEAGKGIAPSCNDRGEFRVKLGRALRVIIPVCTSS